MMTTPIQPVLYVEDEENDIVLLQMAFKRAGISHPLQVVTDGREAVDYLWGRGDFSDRGKYPLPCLVLLDLNLPRLDGFSVLESIREDPQFKDLPVLVFSSSEYSSDRTKARDLGASEYIVKPSQMNQLVRFSEGLEERWLNPGGNAAD